MSLIAAAATAWEDDKAHSFVCSQMPWWLVSSVSILSDCSCLNIRQTKQPVTLSFSRCMTSDCLRRPSSCTLVVWLCLWLALVSISADIHRQGEPVIDSVVGGALHFSMSTTIEASFCWFFWPRKLYGRRIDKTQNKSESDVGRQAWSTVATLPSFFLPLCLLFHSGVGGGGCVCVPSFLGRSRRAVGHAMVSFVIHRFLLGDINQRYSQVRVVIYSLPSSRSQLCLSTLLQCQQQYQHQQIQQSFQWPTSVQLSPSAVCL